MYEEIYCGPESKKRTKDFKLLSEYYKSVGLEYQSFNANPYHLFNHYYYFDGLDDGGNLVWYVGNIHKNNKTNLKTILKEI